ncbi:hypothetical protein SAMN05216298_0484 [Glycomyces sambucus]|uniref:DUF3558 domain-containing protein n=1 Tax=Glycomyces sambucus TaxID=380244 RepID=A0A1G9CS11_9ACTN|nr:hypothetical protein [Glycomyces sambucus]SDK54473.1 hypothetical protein SAMN05216298_0484 [Glycomyces sambucus]
MILPPPPQRERNLWLIGGAVVASLAVAMTATLLVLAELRGTGGGADLADAGCHDFDLAAYERLFGTGPDDGGPGSGGDLACDWSHDGAIGGGVVVDSWTDADAAEAYWSEERSWWAANADGGATEVAGFGDAAFHFVQGAADEPQKRQLMVLDGGATVSVFCWIDPSAQSTADADAYLEDLAAQAAALIG